MECIRGSRRGREVVVQCQMPPEDIFQGLHNSNNESMAVTVTDKVAACVEDAPV